MKRNYFFVAFVPLILVGAFALIGFVTVLRWMGFYRWLIHWAAM